MLVIGQAGVVIATAASVIPQAQILDITQESAAGVSIASKSDPNGGAEPCQGFFLPLWHVPHCCLSL